MRRSEVVLMRQWPCRDAITTIARTPVLVGVTIAPAGGDCGRPQGSR